MDLANREASFIEKPSAGKSTKYSVFIFFDRFPYQD